MFLFSWLVRNQPFGSFLVAIIITNAVKILFYDFSPNLGKNITCSMGINTDTFIVLIYCLISFQSVVVRSRYELCSYIFMYAWGNL